MKDFASEDLIQERGESLGEDDTRAVVELLTEQIEFADVLILNKCDLVSDESLSQAEGILRSLNPRADIVRSSFGQVPLDRVLNTGRFDFEAAAAAPGWLKELRGEHTPETERYGFSSFVYRSRRPFHPQRFWDLMHSEWDGIVRSKGFFWLATRMDIIGSWSQAGGACRHGPAGFWWTAVDRRGWPEDEEVQAQIVDLWAEPYGDRRQELVFIGQGLDTARVTARLDACLLTDREMEAGPPGWSAFDDPFPRWEVVETQTADEA